MYIPGRELWIVNEKNFRDYLFREPVDPDLFISQYNTLIDIFREFEVDIVLLNDIFENNGWRPSSIPPNMFFMRDVMAVLLDRVVLSNMKFEARRYEPYIFYKAIKDVFDWKIDLSFSGEDFFEGGDLLFLDEDTLMIGYGTRTSYWAAYRVSLAANEIGLDVILVPLPSHRVHLDGTLMPVEKGVVVTNRDIIEHHHSLIKYRDGGYDVVNLYKFLLVSGYEVLEVDFDELVTFGANLVVLGGGKILSYEWNVKIIDMLRDRGYDVIPFEGSEFMKAGGGPHCLFNTILRVSN